MEDNNEEMEEKDLAKNEKMDFEQKIMEAIKELKVGHTTISVEGIEVTNYGEQCTIKMRGIIFGIVDKDGHFTYNRENFAELKAKLQEEGIELETLDLPDLEQTLDQEEQEKRAKKEENENNVKKEEQQDEKKDEDEQNDEEKDDEKPEFEEDKEKEEIAKEYNVNSNQVIHISKNKKVTQDKTMAGIASWMSEYDDVYIIPGEDEYTKKFIGSKDGKKEEVENNKQIGGKNANITIKKIDGEQITEIRPTAVYEIESGATIAIVRDEHGQSQALYCRRQAGDAREYWGTVIPEASRKNVEQPDFETREFMDYKNNSGNDLADRAQALERQKKLEERGLPSDKAGVQVDEINGTNKQNREKNIEEIVEDLMSRDGIIDKLTVPPGYYENRAEKVLNMLEDDENLNYEEAVDRVNEQGRGDREEGGRQPGERRSRR